MLLGLSLLAREGQWSHRGVYDLVANVSGITGSTNQNMFIFVGIPLIVTILTQLIEKNEQALYVMKFKSRFGTWHSQVVSAICLSLVLTCLIVGISIVIGGSLVGIRNTWLDSEGTISKVLQNKEGFSSILVHLSTLKIITTVFVSKFLGFLLISLFTLFLKYFIKSGALIMIIMIAIAGVDLTGILPVPIFTGAASLSLLNWLNPMTTLFHCIYLLIAAAVFYGITGMLYERKDFLS
jgi:hypothetical protein